MERRCPRCAIALAMTSIQWVSRCGRCGGLFAARTVGPLGPNVADAAEAASDAAVVRPATQARVACPACSKTMSRETFRGIDVDRCESHGIWFDRDEILHVVRGTQPRTLKGLGDVASGAAGEAKASSLLGRPAHLSGVDLAEVGLEAAGPVIEAGLEASDAAAKMLVEMIAGLVDDRA